MRERPQSRGSGPPSLERQATKRAAAQAVANAPPDSPLRDTSTAGGKPQRHVAPTSSLVLELHASGDALSTPLNLSPTSNFFSTSTSRSSGGSQQPLSLEQKRAEAERHRIEMMRRRRGRPTRKRLRLVRSLPDSISAPSSARANNTDHDATEPHLDAAPLADGDPTNRSRGATAPPGPRARLDLAKPMPAPAVAPTRGGPPPRPPRLNALLTPSALAVPEQFDLATASGTASFTMRNADSQVKTLTKSGTLNSLAPPSSAAAARTDALDPAQLEREAREYYSNRELSLTLPARSVSAAGCMGPNNKQLIGQLLQRQDRQKQKRRVKQANKAKIVEGFGPTAFGRGAPANVLEKEMQLLKLVILREGQLRQTVQAAVAADQTYRSLQQNKRAYLQRRRAGATLAEAKRKDVELRDKLVVQQETYSVLLAQLRGVSVEVVETVSAWRHEMEWSKHAGAAGTLAPSFVWEGRNYLLKILHDLDPLDFLLSSQHWLELNFTGNPFIVPPDQEPADLTLDGDFGSSSGPTALVSGSVQILTPSGSLELPPPCQQQAPPPTAPTLQHRSAVHDNNDLGRASTTAAHASRSAYTAPQLASLDPAPLGLDGVDYSSDPRSSESHSGVGTATDTAAMMREAAAVSSKVVESLGLGCISGSNDPRLACGERGSGASVEDAHSCQVSLDGSELSERGSHASRLSDASLAQEGLGMDDSAGPAARRSSKTARQPPSHASHDGSELSARSSQCSRLSDASLTQGGSGVESGAGPIPRRSSKANRRQPSQSRVDSIKLSSAEEMIVSGPDAVPEPRLVRQLPPDLSARCAVALRVLLREQGLVQAREARATARAHYRRRNANDEAQQAELQRFEQAAHHLRVHSAETRLGQQLRHRQQDTARARVVPSTPLPLPEAEAPAGIGVFLTESRPLTRDGLALQPSRARLRNPVSDWSFTPLHSRSGLLVDDEEGAGQASVWSVGDVAAADDLQQHQRDRADSKTSEWSTDSAAMTTTSVAVSESSSAQGDSVSSSTRSRLARQRELSQKIAEADELRLLMARAAQERPTESTGGVDGGLQRPSGKPLTETVPTRRSMRLFGNLDAYQEAEMRARRYRTEVSARKIQRVARSWQKRTGRGLSRAASPTNTPAELPPDVAINRIQTLARRRSLSMTTAQAQQHTSTTGAAAATKIQSRIRARLVRARIARKHQKAKKRGGQSDHTAQLAQSAAQLAADAFLEMIQQKTT